MFRVVTAFAFAVLFVLAVHSVSEAQETCSQAAARCTNNCNTGHAATEAAKSRCTADCANRRTECLSSGRWRQSNPGYKDREGLIKR
jgi:hypothetical protein